MTLHELLGRRVPPATDADFADEDMRSLHESVCDLARHAAEDPERYSDLPPQAADCLEEINYHVLAFLSLASQEPD